MGLEPRQITLAHNKLSRDRPCIWGSGSNFLARLTWRAILEVDPVDGEVGSRRTRRVPADVDRYREWLDVPADLDGFRLPPDGRGENGNCL